MSSRTKLEEQKSSRGTARVPGPAACHSCGRAAHLQVVSAAVILGFLSSPNIILMPVSSAGRTQDFSHEAPSLPRESEYCAVPASWHTPGGSCGKGRLSPTHFPPLTLGHVQPWDSQEHQRILGVTGTHLRVWRRGARLHFSGPITCLRFTKGLPGSTRKSHDKNAVGTKGNWR